MKGLSTCKYCGNSTIDWLSFHGFHFCDTDCLVGFALEFPITAKAMKEGVHPEGIKLTYAEEKKSHG